MINLRPYQEELVNKIRKTIASGKRRVCCVLGCGGGKSIIVSEISRSATEKHNNVMFVVHRKELCQQITKTFNKNDVDFDYCTVNMVQTATRRLDKLAEPKLIIVDESHHVLSKSYMNIIERYPDAVVVGVTATPTRLSEGGLGKVFQELIIGPTTKWLIENKYLAPYKYYGVTLADTSKLHTKNGEFDKNEVEQLMSQRYIFGSAVENWKKYANGKQTIVYCSSINTSKETVEAFRKAGIKAEHLDGNTPKLIREEIVDKFRKGKIPILSNCDLFGEGFDVPDCQAVILLRPTKSLSLHIQQSMRSMRSDGKLPGGRNKDKVAIILDHVGNYSRHGLPDDDREWSLEGKKKREKTKISVRECPICFAVNPATERVCKYCGAQLISEKEEQERKVVDDVLLEEIKSRPYDDYKKCKTFEELEVFRRAKKYHFAWTLHKCDELGIDIPEKYFYMAIRLGIWRKTNSNSW